MARKSSWTQAPIEREAEVEVQPSENGRARLRVRSREDASVVRPASWRRFTQPLPLIGALLVLVALAGYWSVYGATTRRTPVVVAAHDLRAGVVLRATDIRSAELAGDAGTMATFVPERELEGVLGRELEAPVAEGAPVSRASVAAAGSGPAAFTLVVPLLRAVGGSLQPGDRVTVLATFESGAGARARAIARGLRVLAVGQAPEGLDRGSTRIPVTVALSDPSIAAALSLANSEGQLDLLREGMKTATSPIAPAGAKRGS